MAIRVLEATKNAQKLSHSIIELFAFNEDVFTEKLMEVEQTFDYIQTINATLKR